MAFDTPKSKRSARRLGVLLAVTLGAVLLAIAGRASTSQDAAMPRPQPTVMQPSPAAPDPVPHRLEVTTHPKGAAVTITMADGSTQTGTTPFAGTLMGGDLQLQVSLGGYNRITRNIALDRDRSLDLWLDPKGLLHHKVGELTTGSNPKQVAFSPDGRQLWVTLLGGKGVEVFDHQTLQRLAQIELGSHGAVEVIFDRDGSTAYASQMETASVFEIDRATFAVRRQLSTKGVWSKVMALSPDERTLYVANWSSNNVSEIDLGTGMVRRLLATVGTPRGLYPTPDGQRLFVAGFDRGQLARIDLASGRSQTLLDTGGALRHLVGDPNRGMLYADDMAKNAAYALDLRGEQPRKLAATGKKPNTIDLSPDGKVLYVSNRGENGRTFYAPGPEWGSVLAIDTATGKALDAIVGGNQTTGLDVSPDGRLLAFSDFLDNRVQIFEIPPFQTLTNGGGGRATAHLADIPK
ncbi:MAG: beta-propeller fold lactonase family protein [Egibacteraceae bacterium]